MATAFDPNFENPEVRQYPLYEEKGPLDDMYHTILKMQMNAMLNGNGNGAAPPASGQGGGLPIKFGFGGSGGAPSVAASPVASFPTATAASSASPFAGAMSGTTFGPASFSAGTGAGVGTGAGAGGTAATVGGTAAKAGMSMKDILGLGTGFAGDIVGGIMQYKAAQQALKNQQLQNVDQNQLTRDAALLKRGPSPELMQLSGLLSSNYSPVAYLPGQGYSAPSAYNLPKVMEEMSHGTLSPEAQKANQDKFDVSKQRYIDGPPLAERQNDMWETMALTGKLKDAVKEGYRGPGTSPVTPTRGHLPVQQVAALLKPKG